MKPNRIIATLLVLVSCGASADEAAEAVPNELKPANAGASQEQQNRQNKLPYLSASVRKAREQRASASRFRKNFGITTGSAYSAKPNPGSRIQNVRLRARPRRAARRGSLNSGTSVALPPFGPTARLEALRDEAFDLTAEVTYGCADPTPEDSRCAGAPALDGFLHPRGQGQENHTGQANSTGPFAGLLEAPPGSSNHASSLIELPGGALLLAWFSGTAEGNGNVGILLARLEPGSQQWSKPFMVAVDPERSAQNPLLFHDAERGEVVLLHTSQAAGQGQGTSRVDLLRSADSGATWGNATTVFTDNGPFIRNTMLLGADGRDWLLPMYYTPSGYRKFAEHYCRMQRSSDGGRTWQRVSMSQAGAWLAQPSVVRTGKKALVAFFRDRRGVHVYRSTSQDDGKSWSKPQATILPNNNAGLQAIRLRSGWIALAFNNNAGGPGGNRHPMSLALSADGGATWPFVRDLEKGTLGEYSYPSILQDEAGRIHVTYTYLRQTIKHVIVSENWVKAGSTEGVFKPSKEHKGATEGFSLASDPVGQDKLKQEGDGKEMVADEPGEVTQGSNHAHDGAARDQSSGASRALPLMAAHNRPSQLASLNRLRRARVVQSAKRRADKQTNARPRSAVGWLGPNSDAGQGNAGVNSNTGSGKAGPSNAARSGKAGPGSDAEPGEVGPNSDAEQGEGGGNSDAEHGEPLCNCTAACALLKPSLRSRFIYAP
ncbi:hypothetical protein CYMTET_41848 [Cymbomonas tetramitiformis]|uniref:Sialidase domain-containing protein n=1 Tax=Cymbomonas tetramitiformis TaxID=36881 RepID=A0AAE0F365_9CHLO|nr:hypothetical protein CYMTET_41848 [Cymbomonas tetramitiformis]